MSEVTSPGHKLGQMIGDFIESVFAPKMLLFAKEHKVYCDKKGHRQVRGEKKKVTWIDSKGNQHDLDFVFEKNGSEIRKGDPIAFVELCWRRYTKHSRNKAGEIEGSLLHLGETYKQSVSFLGAVLVGDFTDGAIKQMRSRNIEVLHIPASKLTDAFMIKKITLDYPDDALDDLKRELIHSIDTLSEKDLMEIKQEFLSSINGDYQKFEKKLEIALSRRVQSVTVIHLFGDQIIFDSVAKAIEGIENYSTSPKMGDFVRFELYIRFTNGDKIDGSFQERKDSIAFLKQFEEPVR